MAKYIVDGRRDKRVAIMVDANISEFYRLMSRNITNEGD